MWFYICSGCGAKFFAKNVAVAECTNCGANSWLCHWIEDKAVEDDVTTSVSMKGEKKPLKSEQLSMF